MLPQRKFPLPGLTVLKHVSTAIPFDTRMNMYNLLHWEISATGYQTKLVNKLQNRPARILTFSNYETHSNVLLDELGWESLENKRFKNNWLWLCILHNNLSPSHLRRIFTNTSTVQAHNLRNPAINCFSQTKNRICKS